MGIYIASVLIDRWRGGIGRWVYRYEFNGKENDNEVKEEGNQQDYGMRIYDPRIGKFLSVDPLSPKYLQLTRYQFSEKFTYTFYRFRRIREGSTLVFQRE